MNLQKMSDCIRVLSMDAVQQANSGHPGLPMGMADVATVLFSKHLIFNPQDPMWADRDRFILSAGHGSMLLYSLLHLTGYEDFSIDVLKNFRQLNSFAAGHPEYGHGKGIETTTGPLGQGLANAIGMALAEKNLKATFDHTLVDHRTYALVGDGCLMEGISYEAAALAGHHQLNNLIVFWDNNNITIDGEVSLSSSEDTLKRFEASGWQTFSCDGHNHDAIDQSIVKAKQVTDKPVLIACKTLIGKGSPNRQGISKAHGAPLGAEEIKLTRQTLNWTGEAFCIPNDLLEQWREVGKRSETVYHQWQDKLNNHSQTEEFCRRINGELPQNTSDLFNSIKQQASEKAEKLATRQSSQHLINQLVPQIPELIGGSADLTGSNLTKATNQPVFDKSNNSGSYINYGIREHAMAAVMNGLSLHGGFIPYGGTFLVFSDYCRPSIRLSALMNVRVIYVMTHDSIGVGEDGPTHQPVETISALRAIPNLNVFRPCDLVETAECWELALENQLTKASLLALTRQGLPTLRTAHCKENLSRFGAYVISKEQNTLQVTIIASGSEVNLAVETQQQLEKQSIGVRVISAPCLDTFVTQPEDFRKEVLGKYQVLASIEAGATLSWQALPERPDVSIGINTFGACADGATLFNHFGITSQNLTAQILIKIEQQ